MCASKTDTASCWYNADTFLLSNDGGYHFASAKPPANYVLSLPYKYQPNQGPEGYSVDTNILKVGDWYYTTAYSWAWPPGCGRAKTERPVSFRMAPAPSAPRTSWTQARGAASTRVGTSAVSFVDPYKGAVADPQAHVCAPVPYLDYANGDQLLRGIASLRRDAVEPGFRAAFWRKAYILPPRPISFTGASRRLPSRATRCCAASRRKLVLYVFLADRSEGKRSRLCDDHRPSVFVLRAAG